METHPNKTRESDREQTSKGRRRWISLATILAVAALLVALWGLRLHRRQVAQEASELLEEAWDLMGGGEDALYISTEPVVTRRQRAQLEKAKHAIDGATTLTPKNPRCTELKAIYYQKVGKSSLALKEFERLTRRHPGYARGHNGIGNLYSIMKQRPEALRAFRKATEVDETYCLAYFNLGNELSASEALAEAEQAYLSAIACDQGFAEAYHNLGTIYHIEKNYGLALHYYKEAITRLEHSLYFLNLGNLRRDRNEPEEAVKAYLKAITVNNSHDHVCDAYQSLAEVRKELLAPNEPDLTLRQAAASGCD